MDSTRPVAPHLREAMDRAGRIAREATKREEDVIDQSSANAYLAFIKNRDPDRER